MARALIFVGSIAQADDGTPVISGEARAEGGESTVAISWHAEIPWGSTPAQINQAIEDAAVAACAAAGLNITNNANDRITLAAAKAL